MMSNSSLEVQIKPKKVFKILLSLTVLLASLNFATLYLRFFPERYTIYGDFHQFLIDTFIRLFSMNQETTVPTYVASLQLFGAGLLLLIIAAQKKKNNDKYLAYWQGLTFLLFAFSIDEAASFHEALTPLFRDFPNFRGFFYFGWVFAGIVFILLFGLVCSVFFLHLEKRYQWLFLTAVVLYFGGAVGFEMMGGYYLTQYDLARGDFVYELLAMCEETLELGGVVVLIYALLDYIEKSFPKNLITISWKE